MVKMIFMIDIRSIATSRDLHRLLHIIKDLSNIFNYVI